MSHRPRPPKGLVTSLASESIDNAARTTATLAPFIACGSLIIAPKIGLEQITTACPALITATTGPGAWFLTVGSVIRVVLSTCNTNSSGTDIETVFTVYNAVEGGCDSLVCVEDMEVGDCNDEGSGTITSFDPASAVLYFVVANRVYGAEGNFDLQISDETTTR